MITEQGIPAKSSRCNSQSPRDRLAGQVVAVRRVKQVFAERKASARQKLSLQQIGKIGDICVGSLASSIVRILPANRNRNRAGIESTFGVVTIATPPASSNRPIFLLNRAFHMFDNLNVHKHVESSKTDLVRKIRLIEVLCDEALLALVHGCISINGDHVCTERADSFAHRARTSAEIDSPRSRPRMPSDHIRGHKFVQSSRCGSSNHLSYRVILLLVAFARGFPLPP